MDSRIKDRIKAIAGKLDEAIGESDWKEAASALNDLEDLEHDALLTADPDPCEDAQLDELKKDYDYLLSKVNWGASFLDGKAIEIMNTLWGRIVNATQVADKRAEELLSQVETLREFVSEAVQWSEAYPEHIFTPPTPEQVDAVCKTLGFRIDRIAAMVLREFTGRWNDKARELLAATEPKAIMGFSVKIDDSLPLGTMRLENGKGSVTLINLDAEPKP